MRLALIQGKQNELYDFTDPKRRWTEKEAAVLQCEMLDQNLRMIEGAVSQGADLVATSEAINFAGQPGQFEGDYKAFIKKGQDDICRRISGLAAKGHCWMVAGLYRVDDGGNLRNSAFIWDSLGTLRGIYDKVHLAGTEKEEILPGDCYPIFETPFGRIGVCICWDMQFPECARILSIKGAELILCPTWGWESIYGHARAYENGVYVAAAMSVPYWMDIEGIRNPSEVVAPDGTVLAAAGRQASGALFCELDIKDCAPYKAVHMDDRQPKTYGILIDER